MGPVVVVVVLPFAQLLVEQVNVVGYPALVEELVELLVVSAMRALNFAIEVRSPRADVDMANVQRLDVPMELRLKLRPVVGLNDVDAEGQPTQDLVDEPDGRPLVAGIVDFEHANAGAVVNGGELIQPLLGTRNALEEFHIQLQAMTRLRLFIARPARPMWPMLLIGG